jgi:hypothetical protein
VSKLASTRGPIYFTSAAGSLYFAASFTIVPFFSSVATAARSPAASLVSDFR